MNKTWIFTFGFSHDHPRKYVRITAPNSELARAIMVRLHGMKWAMQYNEEDYPLEDLARDCPQGCHSEWEITKKT